MEKAWIMSEPADDQVDALVHGLPTSALTAQLLVNRDISDVEEARRFLDPRLSDLKSPFLLKGMTEAVERILKALDDQEPIVVWGDYDVDGVTSTTLLMRFFRDAGIPLTFFVPDRFRDGYGMSNRPIQMLADQGTKLLITVDCGVSNVEEVAFAKELGVDVIVVDHHVVPEVLPDAVAVIDPLQEGCEFPFKKMAAVGLTFHLLVALRARLRERGFFSPEKPEPDLRHYLDVVAVGTVADLVPLQGTNRVLASTGIRQLSCSSNAGLQALCMVSGGENKTLNAGFLGFQIGPRINAAGRLTTATKGVELLTLDSYGDALEIAQVVDEENRRRRAIEAEIFEEACAQIEAAGSPDSRHAFVLFSDTWHPGVTGIVASKLIERYYRPTILIAMDGDSGKGSGRSISGFHLVEALRQCEDVLDNFGGHAHAAGLSLRRENLEVFRERMIHLSAQRLEEDALIPKLHLDAEVQLADISKAFLDEIEALAPYGMGNRRPLFTTRSARVVSTRLVGGSHLQLTLEKEGVSHRCIAFGMGEREPETGALLDVAFRPEWNEWRGNRTIQLHVRDFKPASSSG